MGVGGSCTQVCRQFFLLLWKNFILQIRRPIGTVFELILPILAVIVILALRYSLFDSEDKIFVTFDSDPLTLPNGVPVSFCSLEVDNPDYNIFYAPLNEETEAVASILRTKLFPNSTFDAIYNFTGFNTEDEMVTDLQSYKTLGENEGCFRAGAGIVFERLTGDDLAYKIRLRHEVGEEDTWYTDFSGPEFELPGPRIMSDYLSEGFLHLQQMVGEAIIQWKAEMENRNYEPIDVSVRQFPYPPYTVDFFLLTVSSFLPFLFVLAFLYSAGILVKELVLEKESRIRESMLMMGLKQWVLWGSWYLKQFLFTLISVIIICILMKIGVFPNSDFFLILLYLIAFIVSMISFSFFISVWFNSARVGFIVGFVAWVANYFPYLFLPGRYETLSLGTKVGLCAFSNTCMGLGIEVISRLEQRQEGLTWSNVASPISLDDNFNMAWVLGMLFLDSFFYMVIAWYVNGVKPGEYGVPKPFYFPFLPSYWCEGLSRPRNSKVLTEVSAQDDPAAHEEVAGGLAVGISIRNLSKIYSQSVLHKIYDFISSKTKPVKKAVDNLNLSMYKGHITVLLGHNGAGKTTTMSILTGLYTPTGGTAEINGYSILTSMDQIRHSLGICPQHNILFDRLTVSEHLAFFLRLKGIYDRQQVKKEVDDMINDLQLVDKRGIQASRLSGGMKRKLSVGIALVGGSEIVILDEPTSGMDPYARRATWDLLIKHKQNRTMLLTTHFMDEADLLGDRIAIMAEGKLRCSGSSLFLKSRYGIGYHMTIVKESSCITSVIEDLIKFHVPTAKQVTDVGAEASFILPSSETSKFPDLFDSLDAQKVELGVASFGVSITTMEEVFMKVGEGTDESLESRLRRSDYSNQRVISPIGQTHTQQADGSISKNNLASTFVNLDGGSTLSPSDGVGNNETTEVTTVPGDEQALTEEEHLSYKYEPNTGLNRWCQQFWALFVKRFYNSLRFYGAIISQLILPLFFVLCGLVVIVSLPNNQANDPPRNLFINNSGLSADKAIAFYAQFGESEIDFQSVSADDIHATDYLSFTGEVEKIMNEFRNESKSRSSVMDCCDYNYQILDKYCASRTAEELSKECGNDDSFGYSRRLDCLTCCTSTDISQSSLKTCTRPFTQLFSPSTNSDFCPAPPLINDSDSGLLNSINAYVNEHLIKEARRLDPATFFRRYQAGFTLTPKDPVISICDCSNGGPDTDACSLLDHLDMCGSVDQCPVFSLNDGNHSECQTGSLCMEDGCYYANTLSLDIIKGFACGTEGLPLSDCSGIPLCDTRSRSTSAFYPSQPTDLSVTVWYNNAPYHMPAAALNAFHNVRLKQTLERNIKLTAINHPLPRNSSSQIETALNDPNGFSLASLTVFGYCFLLSSFVLFLVNEKESKAKHLQFVSGVSPYTYWLSSYAWDLINAIGPIIITVILFAAFQVEAYKGVGLLAVALVLFLTCWASIPFTYIISFFFSNSLAAFGVLTLIFYFISVFGNVIVFIVQINEGNRPADIIYYIFLLCPTYGLSAALNDLYVNEITKKTCESFPPEICEMQGARFVTNPLDFERPGVGIICLYLFVEGVVFFIFTLLLQLKFFIPEIQGLFLSPRHVGCENAITEPLIHGEDSDVYAERKKVMNRDITDNDVVVIKNLNKVYSAHLSGCSIQAKKTAVTGINLAIPSGECFGLLGVNGAGKTTTFSILTGDISATSGTAIIAGYDVRTNLKDVQQRIGYCPQFDALIERLTGQELLTMFARLRGVPEGQIKEVVDTEIRRLDLGKYRNKPCGKYSGGNKRKLSTAIALVGNPPIILLDEPTTGMDPNTRRYLWDVLTKVTMEGRSIILTSHSMEECEALCTRLAIMVNGSFKCLGSIQHLKNKFGSGFTLQAKVKLVTQTATSPTSRSRFSFTRSPSRQDVEPDKPRSPNSVVNVPLSGGGEGSMGANSSFNPYDTTSLHIFIREAFNGAVLLDEHQGSVTYQIPSAGVTWSVVFRQLENNKERLGIVDYSMSQTTLDQVFINFAKDQHESDV